MTVAKKVSKLKSILSKLNDLFGDALHKKQLVPKNSSAYIEKILWALT